MALGCSGPFSDPSPFAAMVASLKDSTDYKQRQTQPARKKVVKEQGAEEQERSAERSEIFLFKSETRHAPEPVCPSF